jgi:hypothetical protein
MLEALDTYVKFVDACRSAQMNEKAAGASRRQRLPPYPGTAFDRSSHTYGCPVTKFI